MGRQPLVQTAFRLRIFAGVQERMAKIAESAASGFERRARYRFSHQDVLLIFLWRSRIEVRVSGSMISEIRAGIQPHIEDASKLCGIEIALVDKANKWHARPFQRRQKLLGELLKFRETRHPSRSTMWKIVDRNRYLF
jgi:hypothetical protein